MLGLSEVHFKEQLLVHRDGLVGLVDPVRQPVGEHTPEDALVVGVVDGLRDEGLVIEVLRHPLRLDEQSPLTIELERVVEAGAVEHPVLPLYLG